MGGTGDYLVEIDGSFETLHEDTEYIMNGETLTIDLHTDAISWSSENPNIVIAMVYLNYSEDETSGGPGCALPGASDSEPDTIIGAISHDNLTDTDEGQNNDQGESITILGLEFTPYMDFLLSGQNVGESTIWFSNVSEQEIYQNLSSEGAGFGSYSLDITVNSEEGGGVGCNHNDEGEEIEYSVEIGVLNFSITPIEDTSNLEVWEDHDSSE